MPPKPRPKGVGRPPRLSREAIIEAADRILRTEGPAKLSMRRLAKELGTAPMTLYYHVRDKDELLLLVMEEQARALPRPELPGDPRDRFVAVATLLYEELSKRLWIVEVLTAEDLVAPAAMWFVEAMIDAAIEYGHTPDRAVHIYRSVWFYIVGSLIIRARSARRAGRQVHQDEVIGALPEDTHPRLAAVAGRWAELNARDMHREALAAIIDGLLRAR